MKNTIFLLLLLIGSCTLHAQSLDYKILQDWNIDDKNGATDRTMQFFSNSDNFFIIGAPVGLIVGGVVTHDAHMKQAGFNAATTLVVVSAATWGIKYAVRRVRPFTTHPDLIKMSSGGGPSFPSGHTSSAFATATSLSLSYPKWYVVIPAYLYAGTVGVSRIVLGVHYPSDVLAGAAVGIGSAYAGRWLNQKIRGNKKHALHPVL
jgi:membrane-associated phospholipid phosphatase